jgi:hypothetical protein
MENFVEMAELPYTDGWLSLKIRRQPKARDVFRWNQQSFALVIRILAAVASEIASFA